VNLGYVLRSIWRTLTPKSNLQLGKGTFPLEAGEAVF